MKNKYLLLILAVILTIACSYTASAAINFTPGLVTYYNMDYNGTPIVDQIGSNNLTQRQGVPTLATGKVNLSVDYSGTNQDHYDLSVSGLPTGDRTMQMWLYADGFNDRGSVLFDNVPWVEKGAATQGVVWYVDFEPKTFGIQFRDGGADKCSLAMTSAIVAGSWYHVLATFNGTSKNCTLYINGTYNHSTSNALVGNINTNNDLYVADTNGGGRNWNGKIDEIYVWNRILNTSEISTAFARGNNGTSLIAPAPPVSNDTLNLSDPRPVNESQFNVNPVSFWVLGNASSPWMCRLYINGTLNQTSTELNGTNVNCSFDVNITGMPGQYNYYFRGNTTSDEENTTTNIFYFDNVNPVIASTNFTNLSIWYSPLGNLTGQFNITDNFYLYRVTSFIDGTVIDNITEINLTAYSYNLSTDITALTPGWHNLTIQVADGHTAQELGGDYDWANGLFNDYLKYTFYDAGSVEINSIDGSFMDSFKTTKLKDRYTFSYTPWDTKKTVYSFIVTSELPISIARKPSSDIKEWIITGNHWIDFYIPGTTVDITRIDKYNARVDVSGIKDTSKLEFNSIGDLNVISAFYNFTVTNLTVVYSSSVNELAYQTSTLNISKLGSVTATNASFAWNGSARAVTKTNNALWDFYNITFLTPGINASVFSTQLVWFYNVTSPINNLTGNLTFNQTVISIGIDNCSVYTTRAVNITLLDEGNSSPIVGSIDGYFNVWIDIISQFREFNLTWGGNSTYGICINNATNNFTTNGQMEYYATGYQTKTYYLNNYTLDNVTDILDLYLTLNTTQVTITVTDENDDPVPNVFIHVQSYDVGTNSYKTTEIVQTDFQGQGFAQMVLFTQWYQFMLVYQGSTVLQTDATKITSTAVNLQINLDTPALETWSAANDVTCTLSFNNVTNNFRMTFSNPTANPITATLSVYNSSTFSQTLVNQSSLTSASGTILVGIGATPGNYTFTGTGEILVNGETFVCGSPASISFGSDYLVWNLEGIFYVILLIIAVATAFAFGPEISVAATLATFGVAWYLGMIGLGPGVIATIMVLGGVVIYRLTKK